MKKELNKQKGITLVALVITVIVLIILAGVTLNTLVGDNGIITKSKEAKQNMINASGEEEWGLQNLLNEIKEAEGENGGEIEVPEHPTTESTLKEGDYVLYEDEFGTQQKCMVLYGPENENYSSYGIQIITAKTADSTGIVGNVTLGVQDDFNASRDSYNNAIATLNVEAEKYRKKEDGIAELARCVGSIPDNPDFDEAEMFTSSDEYMSSYNGTLKGTDKNYKTDYDQMKALRINNIGQYYWLASRVVLFDSNGFYFNVNEVNSVGMGGSNLCDVYSDGDTNAYGYEYGLRPVFRLKSGIKVVGGDGSESTPYILAP